jgi:hypothetical protein
MERLILTYIPINYNVMSLIRQDPAYKKMSSDDVLERIMNQEMNIQEVNNNKNLYKGISTFKKEDIAVKANKSMKKKVLIESPSEEEEEEKKRKKKTVEENMMKIKWLYSSRNSTSSSRKEDHKREKEKRNQCQ